MSLINDVLQDLDKNKIKAKDDKSFIVNNNAGSMNGKTNRFFNIKLYAGILVVGVGVLLFVLTMNLSKIYASGAEKNVIESNIPSNKVVAINKGVAINKDVFVQAQELADQDKSLEAIALLSSSNVVNSDNVKAIRLLAVLLTDDGQTAKSKDIIDVSLLKYPNSIDLQYAKAYYLYNQKSYDLSLDLLQNFNPNLESYPDYYGLMAQLYLQQGQSEMSLSLYRLLVEYNPDESKWWLGMALSFQAEGKSHDAGVAFKKAYQLKHLPLVTMAYIRSQLRHESSLDPI